MQKCSVFTFVQYIYANSRGTEIRKQYNLHLRQQDQSPTSKFPNRFDVSSLLLSGQELYRIVILTSCKSDHSNYTNELFTKRQKFTPVQIQSICRRQNKCGLKIEMSMGG